MLTKNLLNYFSLKITKVIVSKNESARTKKNHTYFQVILMYLIGMTNKQCIPFKLLYDKK